MIHIAIVEDEASERQRLSSYIQQFSKTENIPIQITTFSDGIGITSPYRAVYDIILLDIQMNIQDGLKTAELIRSKDPNVTLIFITNMVQYALKGYSVGAAGFVLKPVSYFAFSEELRRALSHLERKKGRSIPIKVEDGIIRLNLNDLYYAEMQNRKLRLHLKNDIVASTGTLVNLEESLHDSRFFRCHNGFLINLQYVHKIQGTEVILENKEVIPLSRHKKKELEQQLILYLQEQL